jgi:tetratricopeptide (TPR) repeat protein
LALSNLPDRNPFFTGREQVLTQLQEALAFQGRAALSGLGGVGKTQTAVEYAHRHLDEYAYALWTTADSREALVSGYVEIAGLLHLPEFTAEDQIIAVDAVKRWLSSYEGWLLILDNADDLALAREFIPTEKNGRLILTTRARAAGTTARRVEVQEMGFEEGALFLLRRATCIAQDTALEAADEDDRVRAKKIVAQLDGLPLALDQAGAYIEETGCGISGYLNLYRDNAPELLQRRGTLSSDHPDPVATTWALSFENIEKVNPAAAELLRFCAFLHPNGIPEGMFSKGSPELGPALKSLGSDALAWNDALREILKYSLLRRDPNTSTLEIHRLVQAVLKRGMDDATQRLWSERVVRAVNRIFPLVEFSNWAICDRLLPQAQSCAELIKQWGFSFPDAALLLNQAGFYLFKRGRYVEAEPLFNLALAIYKRAEGPEHLNLANTLNNLGRLYRAQGRYVEAEPLCERAVSIREKALGPEDPLVAASLNNLAELYRAQGQYTKAEPIFRRALGIVEKMSSSEDPLVAASLNYLALFYHNQGKHAEAEPLYHRALAIREKAFPPDHPNVATSLSNLAALYYNQGQYAKAEPLYNQALGIREKALGREHPDVATSLNNLAELLRSTNRLAQAEPLYNRALAIWETATPEHSNVATCLENCALCLRAMDRSKEAEVLESRARAIRAKSS